MPPTDITELRRLHEAATKGQNWQEAAMFTEACKLALPALLDELEAARKELEALKVPLAVYERHTKLIGAAEWLVANNERLDTMNRSDVEEVAAQLRREAEDATR